MLFLGSPEKWDQYLRRRKSDRTEKYRKRSFSRYCRPDGTFEECDSGLYRYRTRYGGTARSLRVLFLIEQYRETVGKVWRSPGCPAGMAGGGDRRGYSSDP